jgi:hypothetical protein
VPVGLRGYGAILVCAEYSCVAFLVAFDDRIVRMAERISFAYGNYSEARGYFFEKWFCRGRLASVMRDLQEIGAYIFSAGN